MSNQTPRFTTSNRTTNERLSSNTVGLVALDDFRKRRAEVLEQQEREAREAVLSTPDRSLTGTPDNAASDSGSGTGRPLKKKKKKLGGTKLSFGDDDEGEEADEADVKSTKSKDVGADGRDADAKNAKSKIAANKAVGIVPKSVTKAALRREAAEREALRREFLLIQEAVRATEVAIPFVFHDGSNTPGGIVRVKKGDYVWVFLDKSRKVGADLGIGEKANARREWARVGVDDLMLVRGTVIIPHHYDFYFFVINKATGPGGVRLFDYSAETSTTTTADSATDDASAPLITIPGQPAGIKGLADLSTLEGAKDDPTFTKVVDRRWYERNKHIYPASLWQEFDPEKDYMTEIRRDTGGNAFFYSK